jgi:hypothetical protein
VCLGACYEAKDYLSRHRKLVLLLICVLLMVYFLKRDYAWHLILIHGIIDPEREGCDQSSLKSADEMFTNYPPPSHLSTKNTWPSTTATIAGGAAGGAAGVSNSVSNGHVAASFGILMLFDEFMLKDPMTLKSVENKKSYAALHGYEVIVVHGDSIESTRPPAWSKFIALKQYLVQFDYLIFFDVDTIIMNDEITLESLAARGDLIISEDWNGLNTGVFMLKNCEWSLWLLEEAWGEKVSVIHISNIDEQDNSYTTFLYFN